VSRPPRDRQAERTAIQGAAGRLLSGTPAGRLSATELITESGLARWKVYEHRDLIEEFRARVKAADIVPDAMRCLMAENERLRVDLAETAAALTEERARMALLRRVLTETSIELEQIRQHPAADATVVRLPASRRHRRAPGLPTNPD
jgi:hypothetical protein